MKRQLACALLLGSLVVPSAQAKVCAMDNPPAASLLLPYFEVDLASSGGRTTLFSIANASAAAHLAHVTLWTDVSVPTLSFDVYLTGYDIQTINLRDVFDGVLPATADAARDPNDIVSPKGVFSQDLAFAGCAGLLPPTPLSASQTQSLRRAHSGLSLPEDPTRCAGRPFGDGVARGYVTVDVTSRCTILTPADSGYFGAGGVAAYDNALWGDYYYVQAGHSSLAQAQNLVRLEATPSQPNAPYSFYNAYLHSTNTGADAREPLPTTWAVRFLAGGGFQGATDLIVWRDPKEGDGSAPFVCGPYSYPFGGQRLIVAFDEEENSAVVSFNCLPFSGQTCSPFATANRIRVGGSQLPVPFEFGWLFLDLNQPFLPLSPQNPLDASWVGTVMSSQGLFSVGLAGTPLDNGCAPFATDLDPVHP